MFTDFSAYRKQAGGSRYPHPLLHMPRDAHSREQHAFSSCPAGHHGATCQMPSPGNTLINMRDVT